MSSTTESPPPQESPDAFGAFPRLSDEQIATLAGGGERRQVRPGEVLYREGEGNHDFFVILTGKVAIAEESPTGRRIIGVHGPRRFLGDLGLVMGQAEFVTAVVLEPGEVLILGAERLREIVTQDQNLGDLILRALIMRRSILLGLGVGIRIIGSRYAPDTHRLRSFAMRNRLPHHWIDLESDPAAEALLRRLGVKPSECPVVLLAPGHVLRNPGNRELARALGLRPAPEREITCDLLVVGAGPAGLAAATYGASEGLNTVVLEAVAAGGQAGLSPRIENYLGFPAGISGMELAERAAFQARKFGASIALVAEAVGLESLDGAFRIRLEDGGSAIARAVVIASGVRYRRLALPGVEALEGLCIHYAATEIEARQCRGDPAVAVGGGNSAGQGVLMLARYVPHLTLVIRERELGENMSRYLAERIANTPTIEVLTRSEVRELVAGEVLEGVIVEDLDTGERRRVGTRTLFVFIGGEPHTRWLSETLALDAGGYILTGEEARGVRHGHNGVRQSSLAMETSLQGVFAAGDVRSGSTPRIAAAVGDGAIAVRNVHQFLDGRGQVVRLAQHYAAPVTAHPEPHRPSA